MLPNKSNASSISGERKRLIGKGQANTLIGLFCIIAALLIVFVWVPFDSTSGIVERSRGKYIIGDGLAPTVAGVFILISGLMLLFLENNAAKQPFLTKSNLQYLGVMLSIFVGGAIIMLYAGPLAVSLLTEEEYRLMRDAVPWKYLGFVLGGTTIVTGMISIVEGRLSLRNIAIGFAATFVMIVLYDLPFDDLLLPPNGDY